MLLCVIRILAITVAMAASLSQGAIAQTLHALVIGVGMIPMSHRYKKPTKTRVTLLPYWKPPTSRLTSALNPFENNTLATLTGFSARLSRGDESVVCFAGHGVAMHGQAPMVDATRRITGRVDDRRHFSLK